MPWGTTFRTSVQITTLAVRSGSGIGSQSVTIPRQARAGVPRIAAPAASMRDGSVSRPMTSAP
jgi:hypothetical protein